MKNLFEAGPILIICFLLGLAGSPLRAQRVEKITPPIIQMGRVGQGQVLQGEILFRNGGKKDLVIQDVQTSCGCTVTQVSRRTIQPGDTGRIAFEIQTTGFRGEIRKSIEIYFREPAGEPFRYTVFAHVYQEIELKPRTLSFRVSRTLLGEPQTRQLILSNRGTMPLQIESIYVPKKLLEVVPEFHQLQPGDSMRILVTLPAAVSEPVSQNIIIRTNHPTQYEILVPVRIQVEGQPAPAVKPPGSPWE